MLDITYMVYLRRIHRMKRLVTLLICAGVPLIVSSGLKYVLEFSDNIMVLIYFVLFFGLFFLAKKKRWI